MGEKKKFNGDFPLLKDMYDDDYYPKECVDMVNKLIVKLINYLETGPSSISEIQKKLDETVIGINKLIPVFYDHGSEIETVARESIAETIRNILEFFSVKINIETAIRERDW